MTNDARLDIGGRVVETHIVASGTNEDMAPKQRKMDNNEIRMQIAKLKKIQFIDSKTGYLGDGCWGIINVDKSMEILDKLPNWPESIQDAEPLLDEMIEAGICPDIKYGYDWDQSKGKIWWFYPEYNHAHSAVHVKLATCICLAWLAWKEAK